MTTNILPFDAAKLCRRYDGYTSYAAAASCESLRNRHARLIVECLRDAGVPLAAEQIADRVGLSAVQVCRRFAELRRHGWVRQTDEMHRNRNGRAAAKWKAT